MALHTGGIFSRARGQTSGIIFSEVRTLKGKGMISKQKVVPANPRTLSQQEVRTRFSRVKSSLQEFGRDAYKNNFNRGYGQLPGYQTFEKMLLSSLNLDGTLKAIPFVATGNEPGWASGTVNFGATVEDIIIVTVQGGPSGYQAGTTLHVWIWVDYDGDWRTLDDYQLIYDQNTIVSPDLGINFPINLEQDLVDEVSQALVFYQVEFPAQSPRFRSVTGSSQSFRLEIQDMKDTGKV